MGILISILTSRLAGPIASTAALALAVMLGVQTVKLIGAEHRWKAAVAERDAARANLDTCRSNTAQLMEAVATQNEAVERLRTESERRTAEANKAIQSAKADALKARKTADAILGARPKGPDLCAEADRLVLEGVG